MAGEMFAWRNSFNAHWISFTHSFMSFIICDISRKGSRRRHFRDERLWKQFIILMHRKETTLAYKKFHLFGVFMTNVSKIKSPYENKVNIRKSRTVEQQEIDILEIKFSLKVQHGMFGPPAVKKKKKKNACILQKNTVLVVLWVCGTLRMNILYLQIWQDTHECRQFHGNNPARSKI